MTTKHKCFACEADKYPMLRPSTAFLAGIAFIGQFSAEAIRERLCESCQERLRKSASHAYPAVPPSARRGN